MFVGYAQNSKAYRLLDLESKVIVESIYVEFFEDGLVNDFIVHGPTQESVMHEYVSDQKIGWTPDFFTSEKRKESEGSNEPRSQRQRKKNL